MKNLGVVRRIDNLGRITIPKEMEHRLNFMQIMKALY